MMRTLTETLAAQGYAPPKAIDGWWDDDALFERMTPSSAAPTRRPTVEEIERMTGVSAECALSHSDVLEALTFVPAQRKDKESAEGKVMPNTHAVSAPSIPAVTADTRSDTRDYQALALAEQAQRR